MVQAPDFELGRVYLQAAGFFVDGQIELSTSARRTPALTRRAF
jgi:hypothetical protein